MKKSLILVGMLAVGYTNAQQGNVGINTENPKATLEIQPTMTNLAGTTNEGILIPKLTKTRVANIADANLVLGTIVYVTDEPDNPVSAYTGTNSKVQSIIGAGHYQYNGARWVNILDSKWVLNPTAKIMYATFLSDGETRRTNEQNIFITDTGNLGIGINHPQQRLVVNGAIRSISLAQSGAGDRVVYADENGVLKTGSTADIEASKIASTNAMQCNAENRGKMNFIPREKGGDVFGICMKNDDGNYYWGYMVGGNNPANGEGAFGSGL